MLRFSLLTQSDHSHQETLFLEMDGNFKLLNLLKNNDPNDSALWDGHGYIRSKSAEHLSRFGTIAVEVCSAFDHCSAEADALVGLERLVP